MKPSSFITWALVGVATLGVLNSMKKKEPKLAFEPPPMPEIPKLEFSTPTSTSRIFKSSGGGNPAPEKEPWQITQEEFVQQAKQAYSKFERPLYSEKGYLGMAAKVHEDAVYDANFKGKPVPPEVLKDYPDLAASTPRPALAPAPVAKEPWQMTRAELYYLPWRERIAASSKWNRH